jgi:Heat shock protein
MSVLKLIHVVLALLLLAGPAMADNLTLSGTVTYRERIALPPGAQLRVTLVALPDGRPIAGASATIPAIGQVPLNYALNVRTKLSTGPYGLVAEIRGGGRILFRNAQPVPVDPAMPAPIDILVRSVPGHPVPPPVQPPPMPSGDLLDVLWTVTSIGGTPVTGSRPPTLSIASDLRAGGHASCNSYFAEASMTGNRLVFGPAAATRMACAPELMAQENAYLSALAAVTGFEIDGDSLRLLDAAGVALVGLVRSGD